MGSVYTQSVFLVSTMHMLCVPNKICVAAVYSTKTYSEVMYMYGDVSWCRVCYVYFLFCLTQPI